ncbi:MAG: inositol monophosphatase family protein [Dehalococcoidia bacterium]|nr:inositol monophosphatase family protein [Dehalococcoidia bacterium]
MAELPRSASGKTAAAVARDCARTASAIIMDRFRGAGARSEQMAPQRTRKGRGNFVTETDLACEKAVLALLAAEYPAHPVLSEETAAAVEDWRRGWLWVVDPLDGTHNFSQGIPLFAFNIALCHDGEPVLGLTFAPATGDEFCAQAGRGMTVNGEPARVSATRSLAESVWGMDMGYDDARAARLIGLVAEVWPGVQSVRVIGSAALGLAFAACGRYDLFVHHYLFPWDVAPGILMVREAGGVIVDREGGPVSLYSEGVVAGAAGPVQDFLRLSRGKAWR